MKKEILTIETDQNGTTWHRNSAGKLHNDNGPAVIWIDSYKAHYIDGKLHNPNGPAIVWSNGDKKYWINGQNLTESEYKSWQKQQTAKL